ncbi:MAG: hypothetical protein RMJ18_01915 [Candidatus Aenigmarchaeota archaeon]|nr:hypothetical protein [Candidatus Aenigmarchaeota archaeon]MCX8190608.1 hypothetical protein [Candidatus Aenigmarchaeota archaeon]MDW8160151.1 hypothetical protein [Candidatus Aenigmarchaeota archaeon]
MKAEDIYKIKISIGKSQIDLLVTKDEKNDEYCWVLFGGTSYKIELKNIDKVIKDVFEIIKKYKKVTDDLLNYASSLGTIIVPTTVDGRNPYAEDLKKDINKILKFNSVEKRINLDYFNKVYDNTRKDGKYR